jgi:hypothetical protein
VRIRPGGLRIFELESISSEALSERADSGEGDEGSSSEFSFESEPVDVFSPGALRCFDAPLPVSSESEGGAEAHREVPPGAWTWARQVVEGLFGVRRRSRRSIERLHGAWTRADGASKGSSEPRGVPDVRRSAPTGAWTRADGASTVSSEARGVTDAR